MRWLRDADLLDVERGVVMDVALTVEGDDMGALLMAASARLCEFTGERFFGFDRLRSDMKMTVEPIDAGRWRASVVVALDLR